MRQARRDNNLGNEGITPLPNGGQTYPLGGFEPLVAGHDGGAPGRLPRRKPRPPRPLGDPSRMTPGLTGRNARTPYGVDPVPPHARTAPAGRLEGDVRAAARHHGRAAEFLRQYARGTGEQWGHRGTVTRSAARGGFHSQPRGSTCWLHGYGYRAISHPTGDASSSLRKRSAEAIGRARAPFTSSQPRPDLTEAAPSRTEALGAATVCHSRPRTRRTTGRPGRRFAPRTGHIEEEPAPCTPTPRTPLRLLTL